MYHDAAGAPWVMPSPNMPTLDTAIVYPGTVLFEGTNVSEGRGTTRPFELIGAPWVVAETFAADLNRRKLDGVVFRPAVFEPTFHKHVKETCGGCQLHVIDRNAFRPVLAAVLLTEAFRNANRDRFRWRDPPYEYEHEKLPIDILAGSAAVREQIDANVPAEAIARSWEAGVAGFERIRSRFLSYS
jgi:uncharacterized protein YbbC (DUF1343 family)